jgi:hypothetical protein
MTRSYLTSERLARLVDQLSERDLAVLATLEKVRLASAAQLERLHFAEDASQIRRRALLGLANRRLVVRLDRVIGGVKAGSSGYLYVLSEIGQRVLNESHDGPRRRPTTPGVSFIRHALTVTEIYVRLVERARKGRIELLEFTAEPDCWRYFPGRGGGRAVLKPDAFIRIASGEYEDSWMLEVDLGSESPTTLVTKLDTYRAYWSSGTEQASRGVFPRVLWTAPDQRRAGVITDCCGRQPAEAWSLFMVTLFEGAVGLLAGETP